jgi:UTP---glucose-1-phosphate uridylyltransferase
LSLGVGLGGGPPPTAASLIPTRSRAPPPTPVVVMTSDAKGNHARVEALLSAAGWYGRGRDSFRLVRQPLVPLLALAPAGRWLLGGPLAPEARPGGHGALWKLMADGGAFAWLRQRGRVAALVRQISNPLAGTDGTLLALAGVGLQRGAEEGGGGGARPGFGFVACPRRPGAAEGVVALREAVDGATGKASYGVTNVEYTEWGDGAGGGVGGGGGGGGGSGGGRSGGSGGAAPAAAAPTTVTPPSSAPPPDLPANTNVLFVGLDAAADAVASASHASATSASASAALPGLVFNASKAVRFADAAAGGVQSTVRAGRLECTMQALADHLPGPAGSPPPSGSSLDAIAATLPTFALHAARRQVTSSAKRAAPPGLDLVAHPAAAAQTPEGAYADAAANAADLLRACGVAVPPTAGAPGTAGTAAGVAFHWHPALGPLWSVIAQKLRGGALAPGSELVLDVAEAAVTGLRLDGSMLVRADAPLGHWEPAGEDEDGENEASPPPRLVYSHRAGRVRLSGVTVVNAGVDWAAPGTQAWSRRLARPGGCAAVTLHGQSEFDAADCVFTGDVAFDVPHGYKMTVRADVRARDGLRRTLTRLPRAGEGEGGGRAPSWEWAARWGPGGAVVLEMVEGRPGGSSGGVASGVPAPANDTVRPPCDWSAASGSFDAFSHEHCGSVPPWVDARTGPVVLAPPPPVEAGAWEI